MSFTEIDNPELYFQVKLYTGDNSATQAQTLDGSEDMQPDLVWVKSRSGAESHCISDSVRGGNKQWFSDQNAAEGSNTTYIKSFDSDGFTVGLGGFTGQAQNYVGWCWKESVTAGFDILTYVGNHTSGRTVAHSLSAIPHWMIIKNLNSAEKPAVYHKGVDTSSPEDYLMVLSDTSARFDDLSFLNDTAPTSSIFTLGNTQGISENGSTMVAYLWTSKQGFSKFSKFIGNGSTDGTFVYTGFRPAYVMYKRANSTGSWYIHDAKRNPHNVTNTVLLAQDTDADSTASSKDMDFLSNGFKMRNTGGERNGSGDTIFYMAFAEQPFVNSSGVPNNAR